MLPQAFSRLLICAAALSCLPQVPAFAFPGSLDTTFGCAAGSGCTGTVMTGVPAPSGVASAFGLALQPADGKIVMAGTAGSTPHFAAARFNTNGTLDTTFNGSGTTTVAVTNSTNDHANGVAIQSDGKIVAGGGALVNFVWNFAAARFNSNGTLDTGFGTKTATIASTYNEAYAIAVDGAGNVVLGGKAGDSPATDFALVRFTSSGSLDVTFNGSGKVRTPISGNCASSCVGQIQGVAIQSDGKIVVAGWSGPLNNADFVLARYNSNGTLDTSFGTNGIKIHSISGGNDEALAIKIITLADSTQRLLVAGITNPTGSKASYAIARYTMSGAVDTAFGTNGVVTTSISGGNDIAASVTIDAAGNVVVGGDQNDLAGDFVVARYTPSGVLDKSFGCGTAGSCAGYVLTNFSGTDQGKSVAVDAAGNIVLGGTAAAGTSSAKFALARYLGGGGGGTGGNPATQLAVTSVNGGANVTAGIGFSVVAQSRNAAGSPTAVLASTAVAFALTSGTGPLNGTASCTIPAGSSSCTASGLTLSTVQSGAVITASRTSGDTLSSGASSPFSVVAGAASALVVSGYPSTSGAGTTNSFTVRARDAFNNTATGYVGTVHFTSTDGAATLPANYTFTAGDAGQHVFSATLRTIGTWSITATDTVTSTITGSQTGLSVVSGGATSIAVQSGSGQSAAVNTNFASPLVATVRDANGNAVQGAVVTFTAPASGAGATFTGGGTTIQATTDASGNATSGTVKANLVTGSYQVGATTGALGPANFSLTNTGASSTTTLARTAGTSPAAVNTALTFTATVSGGAGTPTGTVTFTSDGATTLCASVSLNAGQASCTTQSLTGGSHSIVAAYAGNGTYGGSTSAALAQSMTKTTPAVAITSANPNPSAVGASVPVLYTVTPSPTGPVTPGGNVTVSDGTASCTGTVAAGQCSITFTTSGTKTLTASYAGDLSFNAATSAGFSHTVSGTSATVALSASPTTILVGGTSTITASVSGNSGTPTGTVSVSGAGGSCSITLSGGSGNCVLTATTAGTGQVITGNYSGNGTYGASSGTTTLTVNKAVPGVALSVSPVTITLGQTTTATATVSGSAGTPTGTVGVSGAGGSCSISLVNGTGSCTLTPTITGTGQTITGGYSGDAHYNSANGSTTLTVNGSGSSNALNVTLAGSGAGRVTSSPTGINCGNSCSQTYAGATAVTLTAAASNGSVFTGWLGACTGTGTCAVTVSGTVNVSATFAPSSIAPFRLDIDLDGTYDGLTDGLLVVRYLFGLTGTPLTSGAIGPNATLTDPTQIAARLLDMRPLLDVDGNGNADALTDGVLIVRYLFGLTGTSLTSSAVANGATRTTPAQIEAYIQSLLP